MNTSRTRRTTSAAAAAIVLAGIVTAAGPAAAATAPCTPDIVKLPGINSDSSGGGRLKDFGAGGLAVGSSANLPVYWTSDRTAHAVPLPEGFQSGEVRAVNSKGLMVGTVERSSDRAVAAFTYQQGAGAVQLLNEGATGTVASDVNDAGHVVGRDAGGPKEWLNGKVVRELPVPADAHPSTEIISVAGINKRGDITGTAHSEYYDADNDQTITKTFPVVWPAGGGYPPYSLQVWNEGHWSVGSHARDIDDRGRVVGVEHFSYRDDQRRTAAVWKKPYDALPTDPGKVSGYAHLELDAASPTTNVTVGTAVTFVEGYPNHIQAAYWPGRGPALALPHPAGASKDSRSEASTASDDDRVGGHFLDWNTGVSNAVIWTCASRQAYVPQA
ncbi:hypothetical protein [Streptomyces sp. NPDC059874]|uniref:hypothetical protein n=1 Tax=Streptomyces sp. NPDC059874 TaxID=3346983 RepID=UPI00364B76EA